MAELTLEQFLAAYPPEIQALVMQTRALVNRIIPEAIEMVDPPSKIIAYGLGRKYADLICAIAPYPRYINLIFSQGTALTDPDKRLVGTGKRARHLKITRSADIELPAVEALVADAYRRHLDRSAD